MLKKGYLSKGHVKENLYQELKIRPISLNELLEFLQFYCVQTENQTYKKRQDRQTEKTLYTKIFCLKNREYF